MASIISCGVKGPPSKPAGSDIAALENYYAEKMQKAQKKKKSEAE
jgi:hypothetical protein